MTRRLNRITITAVSALALVAGLAACGDDRPAPGTRGSSPSTAAPEPANGSSVNIRTFTFRPSPLQVKTGTKVTSDNQDAILHTVTSGKREKTTDLFDKQLHEGDTFSHTFEKAGTYPYVCTIHMGMDGTVVVS
jgi:plastocyanin